MQIMTGTGMDGQLMTSVCVTVVVVYMWSQAGGQALLLGHSQVL